MIIYLVHLLVAFMLALPFVGKEFLSYNLWWVCVGIRAYLITYLLLRPWIKFCRYYRLLDYPDERKIHLQPVPRLGGVAIFLTVFFISFNYWRVFPHLEALVLSVSIIFIVGLWDDLWGASAKIRLIAQVFAVLIAIRGGITITFLPHCPGEHIWEAIITGIWLIGITNAINFLDGMDGLVAGLAVISCLLFFVIGWVTQQNVLVYITIALAGSCLGMIPYNFKFWSRTKKSEIFLGDAGSTTIGFILASIAVLGGWNVDNPVVALTTPLLILGVAIFDITYISISRIYRGAIHNFREWIEYVGHDHFHHRLVRLGFSEKGAVIFIYTLSFLLGLNALVIGHLGSKESFVLLFQSLLGFSLIAILMVVGGRNSNFK